jgi:hypothetical protein
VVWFSFRPEFREALHVLATKLYESHQNNRGHNPADCRAKSPDGPIILRQQPANQGAGKTVCYERDEPEHGSPGNDIVGQVTLAQITSEKRLSATSEHSFDA